MHLFDKSRPENLEFLQEFRALLQPYGAAAVGEVGDSQRGLEIMAQYTSGGDKVQMCYPFELLQPPRVTAQIVKDTFDQLAAEAPDAWPCWSYSNHDTVRHITRWGLTEAGVKAYLAMILSLRGSVCLYQGEELGLPEAEIAFEDLQDPYGIEFWPEFKGRDGARTPMVWQGGNGQGGFTTATRSWLPVTAPHLARSVAAQVQERGSLLHAYRAMLAFRRAHPVLAQGAMSPVTVTGGAASFVRSGEKGRYFCAFNLEATAVGIDLPAGGWTDVAGGIGGTAPQAGRLELAPWGFAILRGE